MADENCLRSSPPQKKLGVYMRILTFYTCSNINSTININFGLQTLAPCPHKENQDHGSAGKRCFLESHKNCVARLRSKDMLRCCFKIAATDNTIPLPSASGQLTMGLFLVNSVFLAPPQVGTISQEASHILIDMRARTQLVTRKRMACALAKANRNAPLEK